MRTKNIFFLLTTVTLLLFASCKEDSTSDGLASIDPNKPITFTEYYPTTGGVGTKMIIEGSNFGSNVDNVSVNVNGVAAKVIGVNDVAIYAVVPVRAGTGNVDVTISDGSVSGSTVFDTEFNYEYKQNVSTLTGQSDDNGDGDYIDGTLAEAWFGYPHAITMDSDGVLYVCDRYNGVRKIDQTENEVTTLFACQSGATTLRGIVMSLDETTLYFHNYLTTSGTPGILTLERSTGFTRYDVPLYQNYVHGLAVNPVDGELFYGKYDDAQIYNYNPETGVSTATGFDLGSSIMMYFCFTNDGETLYIANQTNNSIHKASYDFETKTFGEAILLAGLVSGSTIDYAEGVGTEARFYNPSGVAVDQYDNLYVCDANNQVIRMVTPDGVTSLVAGTPLVNGIQDGAPLESTFYYPQGIYFDQKNDVMYICDTFNERIRVIQIE